ncbi:7922_t:CDS:2 [Cetraspora pellucida]|uniref:7922_t:CDS:1 n=1 Tax=Cetraspora pellucida TaxID=1433469 RepID=A0A9N9I9Z0_9GLOM|nr:7922_t:CDS:2 [Cetraspora pellucida]
MSKRTCQQKDSKEEVVEETSSYIRQRSFELAFSDSDERLEFIKNLLHYYEVIEKEYDDIDKIISLNRNHAFYFKMQEWKSKVLSGPLNDFDNESVHSKPCSVSSKSLYISNDGFVVLEKNVQIKETLEEIKKNRYSSDELLILVESEMTINKNLTKDAKDNINKLEKNILVGGGKNSNESYMDCAIREAKKEAEVNIKLENLKIISTIEEFQVFPNSEGQQILCRTVIFYTITNQILQHTKKDNHSEWILVDLKKLSEYDMTDSIKEYMSIIFEVINKKIRTIRNAESKKRSAAKRKHKEIEVEEKVTDKSSSKDENVESKAFGLLVYKIKVTQEDNGINIIVTYKEKVILIQYKNIKKSISVQTVRVFESAISRFSSDSLEIIVYNSKKLKEKKYATVKAKL